MYVDSDTGLESMSSAEAGAACGGCAAGTGREVTPRDAEMLRQEVCRLKNDKLDLLKQNIVSIRLWIFCIGNLILKMQGLCLNKMGAPHVQSK